MLVVVRVINYKIHIETYLKNKGQVVFGTSFDASIKWAHRLLSDSLFGVDGLRVTFEGKPNCVKHTFGKTPLYCAVNSAVH